MNEEFRKLAENAELRVQTCLEIENKILELFQENNLNQAEKLHTVRMLEDFIMAESIKLFLEK